MESEREFDYDLEIYYPEKKDVLRFIENMNKFRNLKKLILYYNNFNDSLLLTTLNDTITEIYINECYLYKLPKLPDNLITLNCETNLLSELPELPLTLQFLICNNNKLTKLPNLPASLIYFSCGNNLLTEIPYLHSPLLHTFYIQVNFITKLENIPKSVLYFNCSNNHSPIISQLIDPNSNTLVSSFEKLTRNAFCIFLFNKINSSSLSVCVTVA